MNKLETQFQRILLNSTAEDRAVIEDFLSAFEGKQQGDYLTYLTAALQMERELHTESCTVTMPNTPLIQNTLGIPHGGMLATLLDTAMGSFATSLCSEGYAAVTSNLTIHYLTTANDQTMFAHASLIRQGRHTFVIEGNLSQPDGTRIAHAIGTFFIVPRQR